MYGYGSFSTSKTTGPRWARAACDHRLMGEPAFGVVAQQSPRRRGASAGEEEIKGACVGRGHSLQFAAPMRLEYRRTRGVAGAHLPFKNVGTRPALLGKGQVCQLTNAK